MTKHIVCITGGLTGITNASMALCRQLIAAGDRVTYLCPRDVSVQATAIGAAFSKIATWDNVPRENDTGWWLRKWLNRKRRRQVALDKMECHNLGGLTSG